MWNITTKPILLWSNSKHYIKYQTQGFEYSGLSTNYMSQAPYPTQDTRYKIPDNFIALYNKDYISTMYNKVKLHILDSKM